MDTITLPNGLTRPKAFATIAEYDAWRGKHWRPVVTVEAMRKAARESAGRELGISTHGDLGTAAPGVVSQFNRTCEVHYQRIFAEVADRNREAIEWNKSLQLRDVDIRAVRHEVEHGAADRAREGRAQTPIGEPLPAMASFKGMVPDPPEPRPQRSATATMTARQLAEKRRVMGIN